MRVLAQILIVILVSISLVSCDVLLDKAVDCIDNDRPKFNRKTLPNAVLNQEYSEVISASIENEPYDDRYTYRFNLKGDLPEGLEKQQYSERKITIQGTPTEVGLFTFELEVRVFEPDSLDDYDSGDFFIIDDTEDAYYDDGDDLCRNYREQKFVLEVEEE